MSSENCLSAWGRLVWRCRENKPSVWQWNCGTLMVFKEMTWIYSRFPDFCSKIFKHAGEVCILTRFGASHFRSGNSLWFVPLGIRLKKTLDAGCLPWHLSSTHGGISDWSWGPRFGETHVLFSPSPLWFRSPFFEPNISQSVTSMMNVLNEMVLLCPYLRLHVELKKFWTFGQ